MIKKTQSCRAHKVDRRESRTIELWMCRDQTTVGITIFMSLPNLCVPFCNRIECFSLVRYGFHFSYKVSGLDSFSNSLACFSIGVCIILPLYMGLAISICLLDSSSCFVLLSRWVGQWGGEAFEGLCKGILMTNSRHITKHYTRDVLAYHVTFPLWRSLT